VHEKDEDLINAVIADMNFIYEIDAILFVFGAHGQEG